MTTRKAKRQLKRTIRQATTRKQNYKILDNGGTPYVVEISPSAIRVLQKKKELYRTPYERVFLGDKTGRLSNNSVYQKGSSILVQQKPNHYVYIGSEIYSFRTTEPIVAYESIVGPSETPYPYAVGTEHTYFMLDKEKVPNSLLDLKKDAYGQFYGYTVSKTKEAAIEKKKTPFKATMIHKP